MRTQAKDLKIGDKIQPNPIFEKENIYDIMPHPTEPKTLWVMMSSKTIHTIPETALIEV